MARKITILFLLVLSATSCSKYFHFDNLYDKGKYLEAFEALGEIQKTNQVQFQSRFVRIVTRLAIDGDQDFIRKLENLANDGSLLAVYPELAGQFNFARTFIAYKAAKAVEEYSTVISNLADERTFPAEFQAESLFIRGYSYYKTGEYDRALDDLNRSYRIMPFLDNYYFIGMCYFNKNDIPNAKKYFQTVIDESSNDFMKSLAYFQMGEICYFEESDDNSNYERALDYYVNAVNCYCDSSEYNTKIAKCLQKLGYQSLFPKFLKTSLRINKDNATAWFLLNIN
jgi:tetratricopeptide (TPR) repeat protein